MVTGWGINGTKTKTPSQKPRTCACPQSSEGSRAATSNKHSTIKRFHDLETSYMARGRSVKTTPALPTLQWLHGYKVMSAPHASLGVGEGPSPLLPLGRRRAPGVSPTQTAPCLPLTQLQLPCTGKTNHCFPKENGTKGKLDQVKLHR